MEHKFRAWIPSQKIFCKFDLRACRLNDGAMGEEEFEEAEITAYTGLKDCKGVEAYHKDITQDTDGDKYLIEWDSKEGGFYLKGIGLNCLGAETESLSLSAIKTQTIIGNVTESPELMEAQ